MKIAHNSHFIPSQLEAGFRKWEGNSSILLDQLFEAEDLVFFEQLQHKYDHPPHYFSAVEKDKEWDNPHPLQALVTSKFVNVSGQWWRDCGLVREHTQNYQTTANIYKMNL